MSHLLYIVLNDQTRERVTREDCDSAEQAGIIDRTLLQKHAFADGDLAKRLADLRAELDEFDSFGERVIGRGDNSALIAPLAAMAIRDVLNRFDPP